MPDDQDVQDLTLDTLDGLKISVVRHPTLFTYYGRSESLSRLHDTGVSCQSRHTPHGEMVQVDCHSESQRDEALAIANKTGPTSAIFQVRGTGEEIVLSGRILVRLDKTVTDIPVALRELVTDFKLRRERDMADDTYVFSVADGFEGDLLEMVGVLRNSSLIDACQPEFLIQHQRHYGDQDQLGPIPR